MRPSTNVSPLLSPFAYDFFPSNSQFNFHYRHHFSSHSLFFYRGLFPDPSFLFALFLQKNRSFSSASSAGSGGTIALDNRRHLMELDEGELFMELIRDVANELDIDVLCHKILVNVGLLTHADRGSLFLAKGPPNSRYLVAKLFDVTQTTRKFSLISKNA